jgi:hypothetical protein
MKRPVSALFVTALFVAVASGCQSGDAHQSTSPTPSASNPQQIPALALEYSRCVRDHGIPSFPDPTISDGNISYGTDDSMKAAVVAHPDAIAACKSIQDRISQAGGKNQQLTAAEKQKLVEFAGCVRKHGVPEWPDPDADGRFTLTDKLESEAPETRIYPAFEACKQYWEGSVNFHGDKK